MHHRRRRGHGLLFGIAMVVMVVLLLLLLRFVVFFSRIRWRTRFPTPTKPLTLAKALFMTALIHLAIPLKCLMHQKTSS